MAPQRRSRSCVQEAKPEGSRSASPLFQNHPRQDNTAATRNYRLRDAPPALHRTRHGPNHPTASPTDRFIQRRRETTVRSQEQRSNPAEAASEGAGRRRLTRTTRETRPSAQQGRTLTDPIDIEEGQIEQEDDDDDSDNPSEELARGYDPDPGSDESERPRPGCGARLPQDADFYLDDPDDAMPTVEEGRDPIRALQVQRDEYGRPERRIRNELVEAEDRVWELEQTLNETEGRAKWSLERQLTTQNEEVDDLNEQVRRTLAERDNLQDQIDRQDNERKSPKLPLEMMRSGCEDANQKRSTDVQDAAGAGQLRQLRSRIQQQEATNRRQQAQLHAQASRYLEQARLIDHQRQRIRREEERIQRRDEAVQRLSQQIQERDDRIRDQGQQIADLTARLNAHPQRQPAVRRPRQRQQAPPPRRRHPRACKARVPSYREPQG
ncbi:MAG: hypothetical protein LQ343_006494 [Gyalolechia ehrenbergii]|nr:MAG: hypothetical protein LQ343_006494 [Gyalolechia ehrenbergii]